MAWSQDGELAERVKETLAAWSAKGDEASIGGMLGDLTFGDIRNLANVAARMDRANSAAYDE